MNFRLDDSTVSLLQFLILVIVLQLRKKISYSYKLFTEAYRKKE